jgi:uncharacterized OB-fold protein
MTICPRCGTATDHPEGYCVRCHEIDEAADRMESLLVAGLGELRANRVTETLLILQEVLATARKLPKKE